MLKPRKPPLSIWKVNVSLEHLQPCIDRGMFAVNNTPSGMHAGDLLLFQVTKATAKDLKARIQYGLCFARYERDREGQSEAIWGEPFHYLIYGRVVPFTHGFSLEHLAGLEGVYVRPGQMNHQKILRSDEAAVLRAAGLEGHPCAHPSGGKKGPWWRRFLGWR